jgi:hypothetical protein
MSGLKLLCAVGTLLVVLPFVVYGENNEKGEVSATQSGVRQRAWVIGTAGFGWTGPGPVARYGGTLGQPSPIGVSIGPTKKLNSGFWGWFWPWIRTPAGEPAPQQVFHNRLIQNFPNPFNPSTTVKYSLAERGPVEIVIFNVQGQRVRTLVREEQAAGEYQAVWDGTDDEGCAVSAGVYLCRFDVESYTSVKKMLMLK